jgi:hypothetical protein
MGRMKPVGESRDDNHSLHQTKKARLVSKACKQGLSARLVSKACQQGLSARLVSKACQQGLSARLVSKACKQGLQACKRGPGVTAGAASLCFLIQAPN